MPLTSFTLVFLLLLGAIITALASCYPTEPASATGWADLVDTSQKAALESRLGIPIIHMCDSVHGQSNVFGATIFPHNVGLEQLGKSFYILGGVLQLATSHQSDTGDITNFTI